MAAISARGRDNRKEIKSRQAQPSPRDVRIDSFQRSWYDSGMFSAADDYEPHQWWKVPMLQMPSDRKKGYNLLDQEDDQERGRKGRAQVLGDANEPRADENNDEEHGLKKDGRVNISLSSIKETWANEWISSAEQGELDVYTCLGLSNAFTWTPDTQKLLAKVFAVTVLQVVLPCIMLSMELERGFRYQPSMAGFTYRVIGSTLYLYSVFSMYNNALDECRSKMLKFAFQYRLSAGNWIPLLLGEFSNVLVSLVLVITLFFIFLDLKHSTDVILNAVAVNFLGSVDSEFVNTDMKKDALKNFRVLTDDLIHCEDEHDRPQVIAVIADFVLKMLLYAIPVAGTILAVIFLLAQASEEGAAPVPGRR